jgi:hypothetical protein
MKAIVIMVMVLSWGLTWGQDVVGTWQLMEEKNCMENMMKESETEKELTKDFSSSSHSVARMMEFTGKGLVYVGIYVKGKKKASDRTTYTYTLQEGELQLHDKKSGIITERFVVEELTNHSLRMHRADRDCEVSVFSKVK